MYNRAKSHGTKRLTRDTAIGTTIATEGLCCVATIEGGVQKVALSAAGASEVFVGWALMDNQSITTEPRVELATIPAAAPYNVQLSSTTPNGTAPNIEGRVYDVTAATEITTQVATAVLVDADTKFCLLAGLLTVHANLASHICRVYWRVNLSAAEALVKYGERNVNNGASSALGQVDLLSGFGEFWTYEYDMSVDWTSGVPTTGAAGRVVNAGAGYGLGTVVHVPDADDASLGILYNVRGGA